MTNIQRLAQDGGKSHRTFVATIIDFMPSQGFYGRLYHAINEMSENQYNEFFSLLSKQDFNDSLDVIYWLEVPF